MISAGAQETLLACTNSDSSSSDPLSAESANRVYTYLASLFQRAAAAAAAANEPSLTLAAEGTPMMIAPLGFFSGGTHARYMW